MKIYAKLELTNAKCLPANQKNTLFEENFYIIFVLGVAKNAFIG